MIFIISSCRNYAGSQGILGWKGIFLCALSCFNSIGFLEQLSYISLASQETQIWNTSLETPKLWRHVASTYFCLWPGSLAHYTDVKGNPASLLGEASIRRKAITEMCKHHLPGWIPYSEWYDDYVFQWFTFCLFHREREK